MVTLPYTGTVKWRLGTVVAFLCLAAVGGCYLRDARWSAVRPPQGQEPRTYILEVTGYCKCGDCCGWRRNWIGMPVIASGPQRGKRKQVGITASGAPAQRGTIAADTSLFPFNTVMYVPGYGYGVVEDRGGAIKGYRIDLYYPTHHAAEDWGRKRVRVQVWE